MPEWFIHDKYAIRMGYSKEISENINRLIDFPWEVNDYEKFIFSRRKLTPTGIKNMKRLLKTDNLIRAIVPHDGGRTSKTVMRDQLEFLNDTNNTRYVHIWFLHHFLDYIEKVGEDYERDELLERINGRFSGPSNLFPEIQKQVSEFVKEYYEEIFNVIMKRKRERGATKDTGIIDVDNSNRNLNLYESIQQAAKRSKEKRNLSKIN